MPRRELIVSGGAAGRRAALRQDEALVRVAFDGDDAAPRAGDVISGRVRKVSAALGAAFVDIGFRRDGLLMRADWGGGAPAVVEGAGILVRVLRAATPGKGPKLARLIDPPEAPAPRPPAFVSRGPSPVDTLLAEAEALGVDTATCDDAALAAALRRWPGTPPRVTLLPTAGSAFRACDIDADIEAALAPVVALPGGGRITIAETAAFVAIDVDSGSAADGMPARTALAVNREAAAAIGRAIVLRHLAGTIVVDFIAMSCAGHRAEIAAAMRSALGVDGGHLRIAGFTRLGLFEIRRERRGPSLSEAMLSRCPVCDGSGRVLAPAEAARRAVDTLTDSLRGRAAGTLRLAAAPPVAAALRANGGALLAAAEATLGRAVAVTEDASLPPDGFRIEEETRTQEFEK